MSDEPIHDLKEAYERTNNCCEYVQVLASREPVPTTTLVRPRRPEAYLFQVTVNKLEEAIPPAVKAVEHVDDELAEARREMRHGSLAEMCGLIAGSFHQLAVDLARDVLARLKRAAEDQGAKFHEICPADSSNQLVYHFPFDPEVMMEVSLDRMYEAVGVKLSQMEELAVWVKEEHDAAARCRRARDADRDWPPEVGWGFCHGKASYNGRVFALSGTDWKLLEALARSETPLTESQLCDAGWEHDQEAETNTIRNHLSTLRSKLRKELHLKEGFDPIPCVDRRENRAWELHPDLKGKPGSKS